LSEDAHHRIGHHGRLAGLDDGAGLAAEVLVAGDAAQKQAEPHARLHAEPILHLYRLEPDVVGVLQHCDGPAPSKPTLNLRGSHKASGR
jgi:hypothetical protein